MIALACFVGHPSVGAFWVSGLVVAAVVVLVLRWTGRPWVGAGLAAVWVHLAALWTLGYYTAEPPNPNADFVRHVGHGYFVHLLVAASVPLIACFVVIGRNRGRREREDDTWSTA